MKLKQQPRAARGRVTTRRPPRRPLRALTSRRGAARPGVPLGRRIAARLPSLARIAAVLGAAAAAGALVALLGGPWLRVSDVAYGGQRYTAADDLDRILADARGQSVLAVDTAAIRARIERLPAVASASVRATVFGELQATVREHEAAFVWHTASSRFLGASDGTVFAEVGTNEALSADVAGLPQIRDERFVARLITVGDVIDASVLETALRVVAIDPATLGSAATYLTLRLDDEFGFRLVSQAPAWEVALGAYGTDPTETSADAAARLDRQVAAVRTLFAERSEADIGWVDVRNPGKVYFRAKG